MLSAGVKIWEPKLCCIRVPVSGVNLQSYSSQKLNHNCSISADIRLQTSNELCLTTSK